MYQRFGYKRGREFYRFRSDKKEIMLQKKKKDICLNGFIVQKTVNIEGEAESDFI